jgi:hypothetical protein
MSVRSKSNLPQHEALRWNLSKAAIEFSTTSDTLKKSLNRISASPDEDGLFSTAVRAQLESEKSSMRGDGKRSPTPA